MFNFQLPYNRENFLHFLEGFLHDDFIRDVQEISIDRSFDKIERISKLGQSAVLGLVKGFPLTVYEARHKSENDPRVSLTREMFGMMRDRLIDRALIVFYSRQSKNYRFSLMKIEVEPKGRRVSTSFSNPRRFSFYLGPDAKTHTPDQFLVKKGKVGDFDELMERFSIEVVTKQFFNDYCFLFNQLKSNFTAQKISGADITVCHNYTLQLLNRLMFLYFVQKKGWLGQNEQFLKHFWEQYKNSAGKNQFFEQWLKILFFEAFNNKFFPKKYFPDALNSALQLAPYLNGGLFEENKNKLDELDFKIDDDLFDEIFDFFEKYNFTIKESSPADVDLEIDPKLIGDVYESLVNVSDQDNERGERGIFYTDRTEILFMCRLSLAEYFSQKMLLDQKFWLEYFFGGEKEKTSAIEKLNSLNLWEQIKTAVENLSIIDPACGSGSFLVVMMDLISELYLLALKNLSIKLSDYQAKKFIAANCLYGVDVKKWAVHIAELRLWLQLIVETTLNSEERKTAPLLPNLTFKIRHGDSLVQELAGVNLALRGVYNADLNKYIKAKITELKKEKIKFANNEKPRRYLKSAMIEQEEKNIYRLILDSQMKHSQNRIFELKKYKPEEKMSFPGWEGKMPKQENLFKERTEKEIAKLERKIETIKKVKFALQERKPFVWDIDFVEVFSDEKKGFDIVIGNPPYVRQEKIADPLLERQSMSLENKREYKEKLIRSVKQRFPVVKIIDKKSDLYIYFYFHGLSLLNSQGVFCFITSNSWLDVGYGRDLQEFLLENARIKAIFDNSAKRSFSSADVNTVISLFSAPCKNKAQNLANMARFVMFKKPFEEVVRDDVLIKIYQASKRYSDDNFRVFPIKQSELLQAGTVYASGYESEAHQKMRAGKYEGDKWGGKYLRAPEIYWKILEKGKGKLVKLGDIAEIRAGIITGNNKKYYSAKIAGFDKDKYSLVFKSPREVSKILLKKEDAVSIIKIKNVPFKIRLADILWPDIRSSKHIWHCNKDKIPHEHNFYGLKIKKENPRNVSYSLNSTLSYLFFEIYGHNIGGGGGPIRIVANDIKTFKIIKPKLFYNRYLEIFHRSIKSVFEECGIDPKSKTPIEEQEPKPLPNRAELDKIVFNALGLTTAERKEVYRAVCRLVWNRISKARSV